MNASSAAPLSNLQAFTPKLVTVLRDGYSSRLLRADGFPALIGASAVVTIILALTIAVGISPDRGMISAGAAMCIVALFGGSSFQTRAPTVLLTVAVGPLLAMHGGSAHQLARLSPSIERRSRALILNVQRMMRLDATGTELLDDLLHRCQSQRTILVIADLAPAVRARLSECGLLCGNRLVIARHVPHALKIVDALTGDILDGT